MPLPWKVLRTRAWRSASLRLLTDHDRDEVLALCDRDAITNVFVRLAGPRGRVDPRRLGAQMWGYLDRRPADVAVLLGRQPGAGGGRPPRAVAAFAERARLQGRRCSSIVGPGGRRAASCGGCSRRTGAGRARSGRCSRCMAISGPPAGAARPAGAQGPPGRAGHAAAGLRRHVHRGGRRVADRRRTAERPTGPGSAELIRAGRSFARIEDGRWSSRPRSARSPRWPARCRASGCRRTLRGRGHAIARHGGRRAEALRSVAPVVTLYVNDFNTPARAAYRRVGFTEAGTFMSVLF